MRKIVLASSINKLILAMGWFSDFGRAQRVLTRAVSCFGNS